MVVVFSCLDLDIIDAPFNLLPSFPSNHPSAVAVWAGNITKEEVDMIERVQKCAFSIILAKEYKDYKISLKVLKRTTLASRRNDICLKFAKKSLKHDKFLNWFRVNEPTAQNLKTRSLIPELVPVQARTSSFKKSPIAHLTNLLNHEHMK